MFSLLISDIIRLTDEFKLLMGEANLAVAKGDRKTAINVCLEVLIVAVDK